MVKKFAVFVFAVVSFIVAVGVGCGFSTMRVLTDIVNNDFSYGKHGVYRWCTNGLPIVAEIEKLVTNKNYVVLLQNNMELRPTGGFVGSYAKIRFGTTGLENIEVQDIYEPDGKLVGHVEPPYPIQEAFGQGWWKLRDANWDPDFATASAHISWFMEQGGEPPIDGILAVNQLTIKQLIKIFGPFDLTTYDETISDKNFYQLAQKYAEVRGDKRGFLGSIGARIIEEIKEIDPLKTLKLTKLIVEELERGQMLVWMKDAELQKEIEFRKWGGRMEQLRDGYLYVVESNLGANKANCCVTRTITHEVNGLDEHLIIDWKNDNEFGLPKPPVFWGGDYRNYVRVVIPVGRKIAEVRVGDRKLRMANKEDFGIPNSLRQGLSEDMYIVEEREDLQIVGFWAVVPAQHRLTAEMKYETSETSDGRVLVRRQPGIESFTYKLIVDGRIVANATIDKDREFEIR